MASKSNAPLVTAVPSTEYSVNLASSIPLSSFDLQCCLLSLLLPLPFDTPLSTPSLWMHSSDIALHDVPPRYPLYCMLERMYIITLWYSWETLAQVADALQVVAVHMYVSFVTYF